MYKIIVSLCIPIFCVTRAPIDLSGLISSSDLNRSIKLEAVKKKARINLNGEFSSADLSNIAQSKISRKEMVHLSGILSVNQLDSVIQFISRKKAQRKNINGLISQKDLDKAIVIDHKKSKPRLNLSGLMVQNYSDPDYQAAFKILNDSALKEEYTDGLEAMQNYFKQYYFRQAGQAEKKIASIELPKVCCPTQGQNYTLCQK